MCGGINDLLCLGVGKCTVSLDPMHDCSIARKFFISLSVRQSVVNKTYSKSCMGWQPTLAQCYACFKGTYSDPQPNLIHNIFFQNIWGFW